MSLDKLREEDKGKYFIRDIFRTRKGIKLQKLARKMGIEDGKC